MPLAGEHIAIGLVIQSSCAGFFKKNWPWQVLAVVILSNAPDIDVFPGIILQNDWGYYHRLGTHSLLYSIAIGVLADWISRLIFKRKVLSPWIASAIVFSHVLADYVLSPWPISFYWPLHWPLIYSHHYWFDNFGLTVAFWRVWFIHVSCIAIFIFLYWREQSELYRHNSRDLRLQPSHSVLFSSKT